MTLQKAKQKILGDFWGGFYYQITKYINSVPQNRTFTGVFAFSATSTPLEFGGILYFLFICLLVTLQI